MRKKGGCFFSLLSFLWIAGAGQVWSQAPGILSNPPSIPCGTEYPLLLPGFLLLALGVFVAAFLVQRSRRLSAERQVRESEERYREIFENAVEGRFRTTLDGRTLSVNPAFARMFGYSSPREMIESGKDLDREAHFRPRDHGPLIELLRERGEVRDFELETCRKDGSRFWMSVTARTVLDPAGTLQCIEGTCVDITERKHAEEALRRSQQFIESILNTIPVRVFWKDKDLKYLGCNAIFARDAGCRAPEDLVGKDDFEIPWHHQADRYRKDDLSVLESGRPKLLIEEPQTTPSGDLIHLLTSKTPLRNPDGEIIGILGAYLDITERKKAEAALEESERRFKLVLETLPVGFWLVDKEGRLLMANRAGERIWGGSLVPEPEEYGTLRAWRLPGREPVPAKDRALHRALHRGETTSEELLEIETFDGQRKFVLSWASPVESPSGEILGAFLIHQDVTESVRVTEALRESEEKYRAIFENATEGIFQNTVEGKYLKVNPAFARMFGFSSPREMVDAVSDIAEQLWVNPQERRRMVEVLRERHRVEGWEAEVYRRDKSRFWISINAHTVRDSSGNILYLEGTNVDITARKLAEEAALQAQQEWSATFDAMNDAVALIDLDGRILKCNATMARLLERAPSEIIGFRCHTLVHGTGTPIPECPLRRAIRSGSRETMDLAVGDRWFRVSADPFFGVTGEMAAMVHIMTDITESKRAEQKLKESEAAYRTFFEQSPLSVTLNRMNGEFVEVNQTFCRTFGRGAWEVMGKTPVELGIIDEKTLETMAEILRREGGVLTGFEWSSTLPDGRLMHAVTTAKTVEMKGETMVLSLIQDITERKSADEQRKRLKEQLFQAQKLEAVGRLAGGIAHDFNNILSAIMGYCELARLELSAETRVACDLDRVLEACERARDLIAQISTFTRRGEEESHPMLVIPVVKEALKLLRASIPSTIEIRRSIPAEDIIVKADPTRVHQIVMNLCTNAYHAMMKDGGVLHVSAEEIDLGEQPSAPDADLPSSPCFVLTVRDSGQGIPPEILDKVFDPYFTTKQKDLGTGLGLAVVKGIAEQLGGRVEVSSELGKGSTFRVFLPSIKIPVLESDSRETVMERGSERILFVDDEKNIAEIGKRMLEELGYRVFAFSDSVEALDFFHRDPEQVDLVVTDYTMPLMTGDKLAAAILEVRPDVPVILCTGYRKGFSEEQAAAVGIARLVPKPLAMASFSKLIRSVLDERARVGAQDG